MKILRWYSRVIVKDFYCELDSPKMWSVVKLHRGESVIDECPKDIVYGMSK